jgi:hypothetical protein
MAVRCSPHNTLTAIALKCSVLTPSAGDGSDFDIAGRAVKGDGSMDETALLVSYTGGRDSAPHMAYSPVDNAFGPQQRSRVSCHCLY